jgi:hypothetical protein
MNKQRRMAIAAVLTLGSGAPALGGFTVINGFENWSAAAGPASKIDFVFDRWQFVTDQYQHLGVTLPDGNVIGFPQSGLFQQDGWGAENYIGTPAQIRLVFDAPRYAIGAWFPGTLFAKLYWQGELVYSSPDLFTFPLSYAFGGIVSTTPFDEVVFYRPSIHIAIDDIYFGNAIPAPGAVALGVIATLAAGRRRRR